MGCFWPQQNVTVVKILPVEERWWSVLARVFQPGDARTGDVARIDLYLLMTFLFTPMRKGLCRRQLKLVDIALIAWLWCYSNMTTDQAAAAAGVARQTIIDWNKLCRQVCSHSESMLPKIIGTDDQPIQVDESYFTRRALKECG